MLPNKTAPASYGLPKSNYDTVIDPTTELNAETEFEPMAVDVAAMTYVAPRAWAFVAGDPVTPVVSYHSAVWGDTSGVKPAITRAAAGDYTITWTASQTDLNPTPARATSRAIAFTGAVVTIQGTAGGFGSALTTANTVRIMLFDKTGAADDIDAFVVVF